MTLRFDQPWWFVGLLVCIPMAVAALSWFASMTTARRWSAILLRVALITALLGMLAGASMVRRSDRVAVIACVDMSGSVRRFFDPRTLGPDSDGQPLSFPAAVRRFLESHTTARKPDDLAAVIVFGASPNAMGMTESGGPAAGFRLPTQWPPIEEATDIEQALRLAGAMVPPDAAGRIILFSDGVQTRGSALAAAGMLAGKSSEVALAQTGRRPIRIDVVPLEYRVDHEVMVESVDSPPTAQSGATVAVRVVLRATERCTGTLQLQREDRPVDINGDAPGSELRLTLEPGRNVEVFKVPLPEGRIHRFAALWTPDSPAPDAPSGDTVASNNRAESITVAPGRGAVLLVDGISGGSAGPGSTLGDTLTKAGLAVNSVGPDGVQSDLLWLQQFDLIILQNVAADAVPRAVHGALATCVTQLGVGLVMIGGPDSFGAGGWKGTELEPILPVKLDLPEKLVTPAAAVILVIDNSGSMNRGVIGSSRSQQDIADEGAAQAVESMDKSDLVGVITFNSDFTVNVPLGVNSDSKATAKLIRGIGADGGTNMPPALREAHHQIRSAKADVKHVIVLSDGVSQARKAIPGIVEEMAADGILVSSIAIGNEADSDGMRDMARLGKGQFYRVVDPAVLPRVLLKAVRIVRSPLVREGRFVPVTLPTGSPILEGVPGAFGGQIAGLGGLVLTQARDDATVVYPLATPKIPGKDGGGEPVLGYWNAGLGRVAAFTSDAQPKWADEWLTTTGGAGYARFWTQLARTIARPPSSRTQEMTADIEGDRMTLRLRTSEESGRPIDGLIVPGTVYGPGNEKLDVRLVQVGPGEYEQVVSLTSINGPNAPTDGAAAGEGGSFVVTLAPRRSQGDAGGQPMPPVIGGVSRPLGEEFRSLRSDAALLRAVAAATGGSVEEFSLPDAARAGSGATRSYDPFSREGIIPAEARTPLWPWLALASVGLMLLDVATRRVAWDRLLSREMGAEMSRGVAAAIRDRSAQASQSLGRLRDRGAEPASATTASADTESTVLGDADAAAIRDRERARRRAALTKGRVEPMDSDPAAEVPAPAIAPPPAPTVPSPEESGLAAAKRRAQRRMEE